MNEYKAETTKDISSTDPARFLRFLMGERKIEHTTRGLGNSNESVNPGESVWKWKRMEEFAKETGGRPWGDY